MTEWTIIGGGMQGCTLAVFLLRHRLTRVEKLAVIDPEPVPLAKWHRFTAVLEMGYLRSPAVHHIDVDPFGLIRFAQSPRWQIRDPFTFPHQRPSLELYNQYCRHVLEEVELRKAWVQGRVARIRRNPQGWSVTLESGEKIHSRRVVLAIGLSERPFWPEWTRQLRSLGGQVVHVFEDFTPDPAGLNLPVAVIGGGISAAHMSIRLSKQFPAKTLLLTGIPSGSNPTIRIPVGWVRST